MKLLTRFAATAVVLAMATGVAAAKDWTSVRIGTEGAYPPFNFFDSNKELQGFDIDIAKAVCAQAKVECTFVAQDWDGIIPALLAGKYDAIFASMSATDERRQTIDFTRAYYNAPSGFFASKDSGLADSTPETLAGKIIGAQSGTIQADYLAANYPNSEIKLYPTQDEVNLDLVAGRIDALFVDKIVGDEWIKTPDGSSITNLGADVALGDGVAAGVRKEDTDLRDKLSAAINEIKANGTYDEINAKYFPFSIWKD